jgi:hypothetical protein
MQFYMSVNLRMGRTVIKLLRRIRVRKMRCAGMIACWRKLHNDKLNHIYSLLFTNYY